MADFMPNDLITYEDAASILGGNAQKVRHMVVDKRLTPYKLPGYKHKFLSRAQVEQEKHGRRGAAPTSRQGDQSGAFQASTLTGDDKAILATMGDKFIALAVAIVSALAPNLRDSYYAFFQFKAVEAQGGPIDEAMRQVKQTMLQAGREAMQTGVTEGLITDTLEKVARQTEQAMGTPATPEDEQFKQEMQAMLMRHVQRAGVLTTDAAPANRIPAGAVA